MNDGIVAAAFAGYAFGIALAFVRVVLRYPPWRKVARVKHRMVLALLLVVLLLTAAPRLYPIEVTYIKGGWQVTATLLCPAWGCIGEGPFPIKHLESVYIEND